MPDPLPPPSPPDPPDPLPAPPPLVVRWLFLAVAVLCIVLGVIGAFVPGMPTTVFILMAAWAAARGSPRLHAWLLRHRLFGPMIRDWNNGRTMSRKAKKSATLAMAACAVIVLFTSRSPWLRGIAIGSMACVLAWLWRRPEPPG
ncbi:YbaN family protein [Xylophilus sp.]|uniref:YbaN family protein n=1 Tax=Xylophilus sp. TaxID=2653893 RepID=UPI0013BDCDB7|nr:YbaN family protein [Xylophilus sp.]KAF1044210.1 MAG: Inner membrane protein YbaN [Xylophilus sp.]